MRLGGVGRVALAAAFGLVDCAGADPPPLAPPSPEPPVHREHVTVTATRGPAQDTPASVTVLEAAALDASAAPALDEALRRVPGVALFRRTGSRVANPTTQGLSLRGIGGSGASRALVLEDGRRLNDPFGGWVPWGRVPRAAVERVEVLRGPASDLYGSGALAGVVQVLRRPADRPALALDASAGSLGTAEASLHGALRRGAWGLAAAGDLLRTAGAVLVDEAERGPVDVAARSRHAGGDLTVLRRGGGGREVSLRGGVYDEARGNGTPLQVNDTRLWHGAARLAWPTGGGALELRAEVARQTYRQAFSAVAADRRAETPSRAQTVPATSRGADAQYTFGRGRHAAVAGVELRVVEATNRETVHAGAAPTPAVAEGRSRGAALFVLDTVRLSSRVSATLAARLDDWANHGGPAGATVRRTERALAPRAGLVARLGRGWRASTSVAGAFRAPTLNELYRAFRIGNVLTAANPRLAAERARSVEGGASWRGAAAEARLALFQAEVDDAIANVTVSTTPTLVTRERRNLGRTRTRGVEAEAAWSRRGLTLRAAYLLSAARVTEAAEDALVGRRVPQVPDHQGSLALDWTRGRAHLSLIGRASGRAYEDDRNELPLRAFATLDGAFAWRVSGPVEAFAAVENATDRRYDVGRTPVRTVALPRALRAGIRVRWQGVPRP